MRRGIVPDPDKRNRGDRAPRGFSHLQPGTEVWRVRVGRGLHLSALLLPPGYHPPQVKHSANFNPNHAHP